MSKVANCSNDSNVVGKRPGHGVQVEALWVTFFDRETIDVTLSKVSKRINFTWIVKISRQDAGVNRVVAILNSIADRDQFWSPFLYLRPAKTESISFAHAGKIALYFGLSYGAVYDTLSVLLKPELNILHLLLVPILAVPLYFVVFGLCFAIPWNARARAKDL